MAPLLMFTRTSFARAGLVMALWLGWIATIRRVHGAGGLLQGTSLVKFLHMEALVTSPGLLTLTLAFGACSLLFLFRTHETLTGWLALVCLGMITLVEMSVQTVSAPPGFGKMLASGVLSAWLVGTWVFRHREPAEREFRSHELACGVIAACLLAASISKLSAMGLEWIDGHRHALLIHERSFLARWAPLLELRQWYAEHPALCGLGASYVLIVESLGFLFLLPMARKMYAAAAILMFAGIALLLGFHAGTWVLVLVGMSHSTLGTPRGSDRHAS